MTKTINLKKAVFLDRDGTLMRDTGYCSDPDQVELLEGVADSLPVLKKAGFSLIIITNQSGLAQGYFQESDFWKVQNELIRQIGPNLIEATYFCPELPGSGSQRRKPKPGMILEAARDLGLDLSASYMVGDKMSDVQAGLSAGVRAAILLEPNPPSGTLFSGASLIAKTFLEVAEFILSVSDQQTPKDE
jgi:D-glycero-D-manno-heptose 1,7-bisphosphate phosphatase